MDPSTCVHPLIHYSWPCPTCSQLHRYGTHCTVTTQCAHVLSPIDWQVHNARWYSWGPVYSMLPSTGGLHWAWAVGACHRQQKYKLYCMLLAWLHCEVYWFWIALYFYLPVWCSVLKLCYFSTRIELSNGMKVFKYSWEKTRAWLRGKVEALGSGLEREGVYAGAGSMSTTLVRSSKQSIVSRGEKC